MAFVRLGNLSELAFAAGFGAERGERTLRDRLRKLDELGFIQLKPHGSNPIGFALIPNPHELIFALWDKRAAATAKERTELPELREETFIAFVARASDVRALDVKRLLEQQQKARDAAAASRSPAPAASAGSAAPAPASAASRSALWKRAAAAKTAPPASRKL